MILEQIFDTPIDLVGFADVTTDYFHIPIAGNDEPLVQIPQYFKASQNSGISQAERTQRTKDIWARHSIIPMLIHARQTIAELTQGRMELRVEEAYRPIEAQCVIWNEVLAANIANGCDSDSAERLTKIMVSDPREFPNKIPIHTTGAAVDVCLASQFEDARILIDGDDNDVLSSATDYYERLENLEDGELLCRNNRRLLHHAMISAGFLNYPREAWHYDYKDQMWAMLRRMAGYADAVAEYGYIDNPEKV